jgi:predicted RNase H-like HicB family nuclease
VPALPEVGTQGDTRAEALANAREAIELVIEHRLARGESLPRLPLL